MSKIFLESMFYPEVKYPDLKFHFPIKKLKSKNYLKDARFHMLLD